MKISYREVDSRALLTLDLGDKSQDWSRAIRRLVQDRSDDAQLENSQTLSLPWWSFVALRADFSSILHHYGVSVGKDHEINLDPVATRLLRESSRNARTYEESRGNLALSAAEIQDQLVCHGFSRVLSPEQVRNVSRIASLPAAATFSVPGAGKTTEALACFLLRAKAGDRLLVIAPKNAFAAWEEQLADCVPEEPNGFVRLTGGRDRIGQMLEDPPRYAIITYEQLSVISRQIAAYCAKHRVHVFLDESHRIKSGHTRPIARAVLDLSHLPASKLILSGTPMPQSKEDLVPQFRFLFPELPTTAETVVERMRPIFVRTTKTELNLPPMERNLVRLPMGTLQSELYRLMRSEVARDAAEAQGLGPGAKQAFRRLGRSVAKLLQFVSNPALLASEISFAHADLLSAVLAEGDGPKVRGVLKRARALATDGHKVLIWTSFVRNVEYLATRLADVGALYIHGGVETGDEDNDDTREGKIRQFHDDKNIRVLVANPAAAGEGISLHRVCHHALYLDRTFNAAHYLQSEDRIHRFGLPPEQVTRVEIFECQDTVDETVRERLSDKTRAMGEALTDSSLQVDPVPMDPTGIGVQDDDDSGMSREDFTALLRHLGEEQ